MNMICDIEDVAASVSDHATLGRCRPLDVIRDIEKAIHNLLALTHRLNRDAEEADTAANQLNTNNDVKFCLNEDKILPALDRAQNSLQVLRREMNGCKHEAQRDSNVKPDDGLIEAFETAIESTETIFEALERLRWAVMEHNAEYEQHEPVLLKSGSDIEGFFESIK